MPDGDGRYSALCQTACIRERMAHPTAKGLRERRRCARAERRKRPVQPREMPGNKADGVKMAVQP
ncbi:MAG: hypothetical protein J6N18_02855 [Kiritimatiellae bacterium]|nr:hypothetical protein [Kiritimatiellia bacterium]